MFYIDLQNLPDYEEMIKVLEEQVCFNFNVFSAFLTVFPFQGVIKTIERE